MVIFDTNIVIDHLRQKAASKTPFQIISERYPKETFAVSFLTIQELYQGQSSRTGEQKLITLISQLKVFPYTHEIAKLAGSLTRDAKNILEFTDAAIAATALIYHAELATLNRKDFMDIEGLLLKEVGQ